MSLMMPHPPPHPFSPCFSVMRCGSTLAPLASHNITAASARLHDRCCVGCLPAADDAPRVHVTTSPTPLHAAMKRAPCSSCARAFLFSASPLASTPSSSSTSPSASSPSASSPSASSLFFDLSVFVTHAPRIAAVCRCSDRHTRNTQHTTQHQQHDQRQRHHQVHHQHTSSSSYNVDTPCLPARHTTINESDISRHTTNPPARPPHAHAHQHDRPYLFFPPL
jgi:hypothetical protein